MARINYKKLLLLFIVIFLVTMPLIFWGKLKIVGGDDTRLYYFFPYEWIKNFGSQIISDTTIGGLGIYYSYMQMIPTVSLILLLKELVPFLNTEMLILGINLALGFYFFYLMLGVWIKDQKWYDFWVKVIASLLYCLSTFVYFTILGALWPAVFLLSVCPLCLYFFIRSVDENNSKLTIISAVIFGLFSFFLGNIPWISGFLIATFPFFLFICIKRRDSIVKKISLFIITVIVLSFFALFHFFCAPITASQNDFNPISRAGSNKAADVVANENLIRAVSQNNQVLYPMFNLFHKSLQEDFGWKSFDNYKEWSLKLMPLNIIFLLIISLGFIYSYKDRKYYRHYLAALVSWLLVLFFFTANITSAGLMVFIGLNKYVPGFSMFRNMFDKFGLGLAFAYALLLAFSLKIVLDTIKRESIKKYLILILFVLVILNSKSFILGENFKLPFRSTSHSYDRINDFNKDFYSLVDYINQMENPSRIAWIPLVIGNYIPIQDSELGNNFYAGPSPVKILTNKNDFTGTYGFLSEGDTLVSDLIMNKKYDEVGQFFQKKNIKYIIVNHDITDDWKKSSLFTVHKQSDLFKAQGVDYKKVILGDKIQDFGTRYSLYKINSKYDNEKIFIADSESQVINGINDLKYIKNTSYKYSINAHLSSPKILTFLDPYHKLWKLYLVPLDSQASNISFLNKKSIFDNTHEVAFDYANNWRIDPKYIKDHYPKDYYKENADGSIDVEFTLFFLPQAWGIAAYFISLIGLLISTVYIAGVYSLIKKMKLKIFK